MRISGVLLRTLGIRPGRISRSPSRFASVRSSAYALDDAHIALRGAAESLEGNLIGRAVVRGECLPNTIELDNDCALHQALLIGFRWHASAQGIGLQRPELLEGRAGRIPSAPPR